MASTMTAPAATDRESAPAAATDELIPNDLVREAVPSPAGPLEAQDAHLPEPPRVPLPRSVQIMHMNWRQIEFMFRWRRRLGDVFRANAIVAGGPTVTSHPEHVRSLFTASPEHRAFADRRVTAAADRRPEFGADL